MFARLRIRCNFSNTISFHSYVLFQTILVLIYTHHCTLISLAYLKPISVYIQQCFQLIDSLIPVRLRHQSIFNCLVQSVHFQIGQTILNLSA